MSIKSPTVAIAHDWLTGMRGGEKVLVNLCRIFPRADIFTLIHSDGACSDELESRNIFTSCLNKLPGVSRYYRHLLPLMPAVIGRFDTYHYDLLISSSHCVAKGIAAKSPRSDRLHICYCHTPMRYIWDASEEYRRRMGLSGLALAACEPFLRKWDRRTAAGVHLFIANSNCVAERIRKIYGRESAVLYPPIDTDFFTPDGQAREDFYLIVSALVPYKRVDLAIAAFAALKRPLKIIGTGPMLKKLKRIAPSNVEFLGWCSDETLRDYYRRGRALIYPQCEDFGMTAVEAMACGTPVIALAEGGATETVMDAADDSVENPTGLLYGEASPAAIKEAVLRFDKLSARINTQALREWACQFSQENFAAGFREIVRPWLLYFGLTGLL